MNIHPAKKIVVLEPTELNFKGIIEVVEEKKPEIGKVVAIGKGKKPVEMKKGDIVAYRRYGEQRFYIGSEQRMFISFDDILGVIKK